MILNLNAMQTITLDARTPEIVTKASRLLATGELVAFPTDTVYGVGASVTSEAAIGKLYDVKERSLEKGIPILLAEASDVDLVAKDISDLARTLMARYWPGPLTIIVPRRPELPAVRYACPITI
jgi:L-threonylcarbamoyladenylate synthase